ncbi:MAG: hypothetical protein AAF602_20300 [Myxococcota bacterium]
MKRESLAIRVDLTRAGSVDDLKQLGTFREVKALFQARLGPGVKVRVRSWRGLLDAVQHAVGGCAPAPSPDAIFVSPAARAIFGLLELDGDAQFRLLGISVRHFRDRALARTWRDGLARLVHPDRCEHAGAARAMGEVTEIYQAMCEASL